MTSEQLERTRMQKLRDNLETKVSDARNYVNRFFGAKVCGKCEGCSGGNCDSCKGKPVVSLWDASSSAPAVEEAQAVQPEKTATAVPAAQAAEKTELRPETAVQAPSAQSVAEPRINAREQYGQAGPTDESRLVHLRQGTPAEVNLYRLSGASLLRAGLNVEPEKGADATPDAKPSGPSQAIEIKGMAEESTHIEKRMITPALAEVAAPVPGERVEILSGKKKTAPVQAGIPATRSNGEQTSTINPKIPETPARRETSVSVTIPLQNERPPTILENPCMQAIIKIKYSKGVPGLARTPAAPAHSKTKKAPRLPESERERLVRAAIKAVAAKETTQVRKEKPIAPRITPPLAPEVAPKPKVPKEKMDIVRPLSAQKKMEEVKSGKNRTRDIRKLEQDGMEIHTAKTVRVKNAGRRPALGLSSGRKEAMKKKESHRLILLMDLLSKRRKKGRGKRTKK